MATTAGIQAAPCEENAAALAEELKLAGGDASYGQTVMVVYEGSPPQNSTQVGFPERDCQGLIKVASINDEGLRLRQLKPEGIRGKKRVLVFTPQRVKS